MTASLQRAAEVFTAADMTAFEETFERFRTPCRWESWTLGQTDEGDEWIVIEDGFELGLLRIATGRYAAADEYGESLAEAATFDALLAKLGFIAA